MSAWSHPFNKMLWWLLSGTRGGVNRARIIMALKEMPQNANQLAESLGLDYKTVKHHLDALTKNRVITLTGERYGTMYFLSTEMDENYGLFEEIWKKIGRKGNRK